MMGGGWGIGVVGVFSLLFLSGEDESVGVFLVVFWV